MTNPIRPQPGILDIALYEGGAAHVAGVSDAIKLSSNENPFGPSDKAKEAFQRAVHKLHRYPNTDHSALRQAIGDVHSLDPARIICGVGSDEIIHFLCQAYAGPRDEVLFTEHGFLMYRISAMAAGATPVSVRERERTTDVDAILAACTRRTRLVFIANPNNPTGTMIGPAEVERLAAGLPKQAILVLDGAYAEYVEGYDGGAELVARRSNVFMTRTFSKIYGLGGLRIGWGYCPSAVADVLNRIRGPFNLSSAAIAAGAAAIADAAHMERAVQHNATWLPWLQDEISRLGLTVTPSVANFILIHFPREEGRTAKDADAFLKSKGIILRMVGSYGLGQCLRMTIGSEDENRRVVAALAEFTGARS